MADLFDQLTAALDQAAPHGRSLEQLSHFQCGSCRAWWSIGDAPLDRAWFCTWCGHYARTADIPNPKEDHPDV